MMDPFSLLEAGRVLGIGAAVLLGIVLGASPLAWPVLAAAVGARAATVAVDEPRANRGFALGFGGGIVVVYAALGALAGSLDHLVRDVLGPRTGIGSLVLAILLAAGAVTLLLRREVACRTLARPGRGPLAGWALGVPLALVNCPACAGIITGVAVTAATGGSVTYTVLVMTALGLGHALTLVGVGWLAVDRWRPSSRQMLVLQRVGAVALLGVAGYYAYQATLTGFATGPVLP